MLELGKPYRRTDVRHAVVVTQHIMPVLPRRRDRLGLEMIGAGQNVRIIGYDHAAFAGRDCLVAEEAEGGYVAERPDMLAVVQGANGFGAVLDQQNSVFPADIAN